MKFWGHYRMASVDLPEEDFIIDPDDAGFDRRSSCEELLDYFKQVIPKGKLETSIKKFEEEREVLHNAIKKSLPILWEQSLLSAFLTWSKGNYIKVGFPDYTKMLVENDLVPFKNEKGRLLIINDITREFVFDIINNIRSKTNIEIGERESLVLVFLDFAGWLRAATRIWIDNEDPDRKIIRNRSLDYNSFIKFIGKLDGRGQLVSKLLYFGGNRTLAEVLNIKVEDIDFSKEVICFKEENISYPKHVLGAIKSMIGDQEVGKIFAGKRNAALNPATIFRNFKEASYRLDLDEVCTPKDLTIDSATKLKLKSRKMR